MRSLCFIILFVALGVTEGFSVENKAIVMRINLQPQKVVLCNEEAFLMTNTFGPVLLDNLQYDREDCYTTCQILYR